MPSDEKAPPSGSSPGPRTTDDLTTAQRALLQILRDYQFGRIENMRVQAGQPLLGVGARLVRLPGWMAAAKRMFQIRSLSNSSSRSAGCSMS